MTPEEWEKVSEIYHAASELEPAEVDGFLTSACDGNDGLRLEVVSLLASDSEAGNFIDEPVVGNFAKELLEPDGPKPDDVIGHYRIVKKIGSGGMGDVFHAVDTKLGRDVALKTLSSVYERDSNFLKRFRNEARAAATINHPNVATVYSVEEVEELPFFTMEFVAGETLDHLTPEDGLELSKFLEWFEPLADALYRAHERGIIHRDIKPGNIMVSESGTPKILDFGLARIERGNSRSGSRTHITAPGQIIGTPSYMSPEQAEGIDMDTRSDVFSFGIVMYEALSGKRPFRGPSQGAIVQAVLYEQAKPITKIKPGIPHTLAQMIARCLEKSPDKRFRTMKEVHSILKDARSASDGGVSMDSFARRFYRETTTTSKKWWVATAALVLIASLTGWYFFSRRSSEPSINFENMAMRRLSEANNVGYAQISADGKSILYGTFEPDGNRGLWIRRVEDRNALLLNSDKRYLWGGLALSPDADQAFYVSAEPTGTFGTLYRVSTLGGPARKIIDVANDVGGVSPSGERILAVRYGEPNQIISVKTADGSDELALLSGISEGVRTASNFRDPHYSDDEKSIYYIRNTVTEGVENWTVEELNLETGKIRVLYGQPDRISELAILPGSVGVLITAVDPVSNLQQIFQLSAVDGSKSRVTNDLFYYFGVSIDRQARFVVASQRSDEQSLWISDSSDLSTLRALSREPNVTRSIDWTPDGRIVYDGYENNVSHIWIADADGRNVQKLTESESDDLDPRVSGDGRFIVFASKRSGRGQLWRMETDGSNLTLLTDFDGIAGYPRFAADGQTVVFEWLIEKRRVLASMPVSGGPVTEMRDLDDLSRNNAFFWAASPDGRSTAQSIWDAAANQMKIAVDAPNAERKILNIWPSAILKWTPDGKNLIYRERRAGNFTEGEIRKLDPSTGKSTLLLSASPESTVDLSYSRDGKKLAIVKGKNSSNAVMLVPVSQNPSAK